MSKADEDAIREIEFGFNTGMGPTWLRGWHGRVVCCDAQFVTVNGAWTKTRADYLNLMQRLHGSSGPFRASTRETRLCMCAL